MLFQFVGRSFKASWWRSNKDLGIGYTDPGRQRINWNEFSAIDIGPRFGFEGNRHEEMVRNP